LPVEASFIADVASPVRFALSLIEIAILTALILATRCANYQNVFVAGNVYFTDGDCYARMLRVQLCLEHPGLIVRHHDFENYPQGTTPHTTAPLDYSVLAVSLLLRPFTMHALDLAGALISPLIALIGGWFLWWWTRRMRFQYRWPALILYAISPILVHGTELGRPDHQSLLILLVTIAVCAEWSLQVEDSTAWSVVTGIGWGLAIWVSVYEPLILLVIVLFILLAWDRQRLLTKTRRVGWIWFAGIILVALLIERRVPSISIFHRSLIFTNWSHTIGELLPVPPLTRVWFRWAGYIIAVTPFLIWLNLRERRAGAASPLRPLNFRGLPVVLVLLAATYLFTIWQARWAYFFLSMFVIALPALLEPIKLRVAVWIAFALSIFPILQEWDEVLWPNEPELGRQIEQRRESADLRELAILIQSSQTHPFLAPWWVSPAIAYWSRQPGMAGTSHESLNGIADSARFFLSTDIQQARQILATARIDWVFACDADRVAQNCALILGEPNVKGALCYVLDRRSTQTPSYLMVAAQTQTAKLFRVENIR
jgi:hypothetical protein